MTKVFSESIVPEITAYLALGSNLGDRLAHLQSAATALEANPHVRLTGHSRIYETAPVGGPAGQGAFLNAVLQVEATLSARALLELMLSIEQLRDRIRSEHWGPRTLDLDLLLFGDQSINEPGLTVPHPRLAQRNFVLAPLSDLAAELTIPGYSQTIKELYRMAGDAGLETTAYTF